MRSGKNTSSPASVTLMAQVCFQPARASLLRQRNSASMVTTLSWCSGGGRKYAGGTSSGAPVQRILSPSGVKVAQPSLPQREDTR